MTRQVFPAKTESLDDAIAFVEETLETLDCPMKATMQITVCVEEMFMNVANYAYGDGEGEVALALESNGRGVAITLTDRGMPFDPLAKSDPDVTLSAEERDIGGLGIFMVKKSMDEVAYRRENDQNIFTMTKNWN